MTCLAIVIGASAHGGAEDTANGGSDFFERRIRPLLVQHCYECHSEEAQEQQGGLLLDRQSGWLQGGDTNKAVIPGDPDSSLLFAAVRYEHADLQMPPDGKLAADEIDLLRQWIQHGAPGPRDDLGETEFSQLGDQDHLFKRASQHWSFQPVRKSLPPTANNKRWDKSPIDRFVFAAQSSRGLSPSPRADSRTLIRRLHYALTGLPPTIKEVNAFVAAAERDDEAAMSAACRTAAR